MGLGGVDRRAARGRGRAHRPARGARAARHRASTRSPRAPCSAAPRPTRDRTAGLLVPALALRHAPPGAPSRSPPAPSLIVARAAVPADQVHRGRRPGPARRGERAQVDDRAAAPSSRPRDTPIRSRSRVSAPERSPREARRYAAPARASSPDVAEVESSPQRSRRRRLASVDVVSTRGAVRRTAARTRRDGARRRRARRRARHRADAPTSSTSRTALGRRTCRSPSRSSSSPPSSILFLMTGSVVLPIKALLMNLLDAERGLRAARADLPGRPARGAARLRQPGRRSSRRSRCCCFAVAFGLSTDYGVFLLSRIKEARDAACPTTSPSPSGSSAPAGSSPPPRCCSASRSAPSPPRRSSSSRRSGSARRSPC